MKKLLLFTFLFILSTLIIYPQWINQNPVPDGNDLWSTFFVDDTTGWIVGSDGFIKKTTNAGLDWLTQNSGTTNILKSAQFIDQNTGWICGQGGLIIKTTDGGINWDSLASGTTEHLTDIHFYDTDTGYVVGFGGAILKTTNGGSSWTSLTSGTAIDLNSVDFVDAFVGYAVGGFSPTITILKTTDGGASWIDKSGGIIYNIWYLLAVEFIDANTGFVGGGLQSQSYIFKTTDGGDTWTFSELPYSMNHKERNHQEQLSHYNFGGINSIYFKDSNIGYVASGDGGGYHRDIYTTTNGGLNWTHKYRGLEEDCLLSVCGNNSGKGWAVGLSGVIFITEDDGNSWAQILSGSNEVSLWSGDFIHSVFMINENIGWAAGRRNGGGGGGSIILKTTNGGKIWKTQLFLQSFEDQIRSVYFISEDIGWAVGEVGLYITTDGGENWMGTYSDNLNLTSNNYYFIDGNTGWKVDDKIYKTTDGGTSWIEKNSTGGNAIHFSDINNGWFCGPSGLIMRSTDGGETWSNQSSGTSSDLSCIRFYDNNIGMCVGNGIKLITTNGGTNWNIKNSGYNLNSIQYINSATVMVNGFLYTTDGGNSWELLNNGYHFTSKYIGWNWGGNDIYRYDEEPTPLPTWSNQITVEDAEGGESAGVLTFGQHTDATDSIDALLGEYELPPPPFTGNFDSRFILPTNPEMGSLKDYRDSIQTEITWKLTFQPGIAGYPMTFSWDSTSFPEGTFYLKDRIDGSFVFVNMKNQSSYVLAEPAITSLNISYRGDCSVVSVNNYWNMLSVPALAEDMELSNLFPTATSSSYGYENGYVMEDTLAAGKGYWLKFGGNEDIQICGALPGDTVQVNEGWNMFGAYEEDILVSQLTTTPPGIIATYFFGFEDGYDIADTLKSGKGYWVRVTEDGVINLNGGVLAKDEGKQIAQIDNEWGRIMISDNEGKGITLYAAEEDVEPDFYELPPMPPAGIFDARYGNGKFVESLNSEKIILISSDKYPITIRAEGLSLTVRDRINGKLLNEELNTGEELTITNNKITSIEVTGTITGGLPVSFELYQNYPNPFNPSTTIKFAVPKESNVNLSIYNVLGELVSTLVSEQKKPGYYEYKLNSSNLASGIYLYRIKAGDFIKTKKMVLIK